VLAERSASKDLEGSRGTLEQTGSSCGSPLAGVEPS